MIERHRSQAIPVHFELRDAAQVTPHIHIDARR
jgi:hypothetical protein